MSPSLELSTAIEPAVWVLWVGLLIGAGTDLAWGKIPNWLTGSMMALGIGIHVFLNPVPWFGVLGCVAAFALYFLLFALGIARAGDAKLMMGVGACVGVAEMLETTAWWALLYIPLGITVLAMRGRLANFVAALTYTVRKAVGQPTGEAPEPTMIIAGPIIAVSGIVASLTDWLEVSWL